MTYGLVLSGGGARGAYQAGVYKAFFEIAQELKIPVTMKVMSGVSAGAINAAFYASYAHDPGEGVRKAVEYWSTLTAQQVFRTNFFSLGRSGLSCFLDFSLGQFYHNKLFHSILDTTPLRQRLKEIISFDNLYRNLEQGHLKALAITATNYKKAFCVNFIQGKEDFPLWARSRRAPYLTQITLDHLMASSAIPIFFPAVKIGNSYYGDGCVRNSAPIGPAIHIGASKLLIIGVRKQRPPESFHPDKEWHPPTMGMICSNLLNAVFLDGIDTDVERLSRINRTLMSIPPEQRQNHSLRPIDFIWISPGQDLAKVALKYSHKTPKGIRMLLKNLGELEEAADILSYLLFDYEYCSELVRLGYQDGRDRWSEIERFLRL